MARKYIDCRDSPGDVRCTVALSADSQDELFQAVVQHAIAVHGYQDTKEFRDMVRKGMKAGNTTTSDSARAQAMRYKPPSYWH